MRIAFLGLGIMGRPMASNLVKAGHEVSVWNRTARQHVEGATTAVSPADAAKDAEIVWMCVADTAAVERLVFSGDGIEQSLREGMVIADSSTISPSATCDVRPAGRGKRRAVDRCAGDRLKDRRRKWPAHFHRGRTGGDRRGDGSAVQSHGQDGDSRRRHRQRTGS